MEHQHNQNGGMPTASEQEQVKTYVAAHFAAGALPPFSFTYSGKPSSEFLRDW